MSNKCVWTLAKNALRQMCTNIIDDIEYMRKDKSFVEESIYPMKLTEKEKIIYKQGFDRAMRDCIYSVTLFKDGQR